MMTQVTPIAAPEIRRRKAALESRLKELLRVSFEREELRIENLADPLDQMRSSMDREISVQQFDHEAHLVHDVESALANIEAGTYGTCEQCEETIPQRRLDAVPWARLCVACQSKTEASTHDGRPTFQIAA
jgi:DnaK suppressor protein